MPDGTGMPSPEAECHDLVVVGGGAAGFFLALAAAGACSRLSVLILEADSQVLRKVRISGGGRCNVTNECEDPEILSLNYPRGGRLLRKAFYAFGPREMKAWLAEHGVQLKTEADGRVFPASDSSQTVIDCFLKAADLLGVDIRTRQAVTGFRFIDGQWEVLTAGNQRFRSRYLAITTGGNPAHFALLQHAGHRLESLVPSLFTFRTAAGWIRGLAGISVPNVRISLPGHRIHAEGPLLITHQGISGPAVLRLSAWAARELANLDYEFELEIDLTGGEDVAGWVAGQRRNQARKQMVNTPFRGIPGRLWEQLLAQVPGSADVRWADATSAVISSLIQVLTRMRLPVSGKSTFKEEFVTCGGISLSEIRSGTMESRIHPRLYFAGEVLDIDAVTGGYNFQAAWTTAWLAGNAIAADRNTILAKPEAQS